MLKPKEITVVDIDGEEKKYIITRFPATAGMEILYKLPTAGIPKIGDFEVLKETRDDIFKYVYAVTDGGEIALTTKALIDNHVTDGTTAYKILGAMLSYNFHFLEQFSSGKFFGSISEKLLSTARSLLTEFSAQSSAKNKRR